jgi:hypothetical protein
MLECDMCAAVELDKAGGGEEGGFSCRENAVEE